MTKLTPSLLALALLGFACNGDETDGGDYNWNSGGGDSATGGDSAGGDSMTPGDGSWGGGPLPADQLCDEVARVMCNAEPSCCTNAAAAYPDVDTCITNETAACETDIEPAAVDVRTGYNETTAGQKLAELQTLAQSCDPDAGAWLLSDDGVFAALDGSVATGGDCTPTTIFPVDYPALLSCSGGEACFLTINMGISGACGPRVGSGAACYTDLECQSTFFCDPPNDFLNGGGNCTARAANGVGCTVDAGCQSYFCSGGQCADPTANDAYCLNN